MAPVDDFCLVDCEPVVVGWIQTGRRANGAINIHGQSATAANDVVMIVANPVFVASGRTRRLDAPDQSLVGQDAQGVVDGLARHCTDLIPNG